MGRKQPNGFDSAKLQAMQDPLTVRVMKIRSNSKQPIEIPGRDGAAPGTGFTREDVLALESFVKDWSGGGFYEGQVVDANGESMIWTFGWDSRQYPEKIPPTDTASASPVITQMSQYAAPHPTALPTQPQVIPTLSGIVPTGSPLGSRPATWPPAASAFNVPVYAPPAPLLQPQHQPQPQPALAPFQSFSTSIPSWNGGMNGLGNYGGSGHMIHDSRDNDRVRLLEDQLRRMEMDRKDADYRAVMEKQTQSHAQEIAAMRDEFRRIADAKPNTESDEIRRLRTERDRDDRDNERARIDMQFAAMQAALTRLVEARTVPVDDGRIREMETRMERDKSEREARDTRDKYERDRERDRFERDREREKFDQQLLALQNNSNRPDPIVEMMKESSRAQADIARENARSQEAQAAKMQAFMVNPIEMMRLVKDNTAGADVMVRNIVDSFGGVFQTYRHALESVAQLQGSGQQSPIVGMVQDGIASAKDVLESHMSMKRDQAVSEAKVRQEQAKTQGEIARAQAAIAIAHPRQAQANGNGALAGSALPSDVPQQATWTPPPTVTPAAPAVTGPLPEMIAKNEVQYFGVPVVIDSVSRLRKGVKSFIDSNGEPDPATGKHVGLAPEEAVNAILQGIDIVRQQNLVVPAFALFHQARYADLLDILLPHAPQDYRNYCVGLIVRHIDGTIDDPQVDGMESDEDLNTGGSSAAQA